MRCSPRRTPRGRRGTSRDTDSKRRGRLDIISHLLSQVPYKPLTPRDITLPKRQQPGGYTKPDLPLHTSRTVLRRLAGQPPLLALEPALNALGVPDDGLP